MHEYVLLGYLSAMEAAQIAESRIMKRLALVGASGDRKRLADCRACAARNGASQEQIARLFDPFIKDENKQ